jgi:hypothetical protein
MSRLRQRRDTTNKPANKAYSNAIKLVNDYEHKEVQAHKQTHAPDFTIAEPVGMLDVAVEQVSNHNPLKPYIY